MTSLAATFCLVGLLVFVKGRILFDARRWQGVAVMSVGLLAGGLGGVLCKQNAVLLPFFALLIEWFFFGTKDRQSRAAAGADVGKKFPTGEGELTDKGDAERAASRRVLLGFYVLCAGVPAVVAVLGFTVNWDSLVTEGYRHRDFNLAERLLTQSRVLWLYLAWLLLPLHREYGLFHDDIEISRGWLEPVTTLPSVTMWVVVVVFAVLCVRRRSIWSFAILWYLVGHSVESSVLGLELVFEHRNYLPSLGPLFAAILTLCNWVHRLNAATMLRWCIIGAVLTVFAGSTWLRAQTWSSTHTLIWSNAKNHPGSYRAQLMWAASLWERSKPPVEIYRHLRAAALLNADAAIPLVQMVRLNRSHGTWCGIIECSWCRETRTRACQCQRRKRTAFCHGSRVVEDCNA